MKKEMTPNPIIQKKYVNAILALWDKYHFKNFHHTDAKLIWEKFGTSHAVLTHTKSIGLTAQQSKGYHKFLKQPTQGDAIAVHNATKAAAKNWAIKKSLEKKQSEQHTVAEVEQPRNLSPINEDIAIKYLKEKGYKIMKPIQPQYEEC